MKSKSIHSIDSQMVDSIKQMLESTDKTDNKMAIKILQNRDFNDVKSESSIEKLLIKLGITPSITDIKPSMYYVCYRNKPLMMTNKRRVDQAFFDDATQCTRALTRFIDDITISNDVSISTAKLKKILLQAKIFEIKTLNFN